MYSCYHNASYEVMNAAVSEGLQQSSRVHMQALNFHKGACKACVLFQFVVRLTSHCLLAMLGKSLDASVGGGHQ